MPFESFSVPATSDYFNQLVWDYLNQHADASLYSCFPNESCFTSIIQTISNYPYHRTLLSQILSQQAQRVKNTSDATRQNIQHLKENNTFTITTGHQLCLFTGPLYVIYKIASTIQLAKHLQQQYPQYRFIPLFWMATEDHDIYEINHFYYKEHCFQWPIQTDRSPVFSLTTKGLEQLFNELKASHLFFSNDLELFEKAYLQHTAYTDATRYLLNELFGKEGLVILDPNEKEWKEQFIPIFHADIFQHAIFKYTSETIHLLLRQNYPVQVNPPLINTFYIYNNKRYLLQKQEPHYVLKHHPAASFSPSDLEKLLLTHPENFSANVLLRPLYQQKILPNIAYIGGSAELAYWLQLKNTFDHLSIVYPIIIQRPIVFIQTARILQKLKKLNLSTMDFFHTKKNTLIQNILKQRHLYIHLENEAQKIKELFSELLQITEKTDKSLLPFVDAQLTKTQNFIHRLEQKLNRTIKQKNEHLVKRAETIYEHFFPNHILQDRIWNVVYASHIMGCSSIHEFVHNLLPHCMPPLQKPFTFTILNTP